MNRVYDNQYGDKNCKHEFSHEGLEWYEGIKLRTNEYFGLFICIKCDRQELKKIESPSICTNPDCNCKDG